MKLIASIVAVSLVAVSAASAQELLTNGGFETGDATGWTSFVQTGSNGGIFTTNLATGAGLPFSGLPASGPSGGSWYTGVDQGGPGAYAYLQNFTVSAGATQVVVSVDLYHGDYSNASPVNSGVLDYTISPTQWARVDILDSVGGVVATLGDVSSSASWTTFSMDITALITPGNTYTFRFGSVDNQGNFSSAIDNASVMQTVPAPAAASLLGLAGIAAGRRNRR